MKIHELTKEDISYVKTLSDQYKGLFSMEEYENKPDYNWYVITLESGSIGDIQYILNDDKQVILSIRLNQVLQGIGLGSKALELLYETILHEANITSIIVPENNYPSVTYGFLYKNYFVYDDASNQFEFLVNNTNSPITKESLVQTRFKDDLINDIVSGNLAYENNHVLLVLKILANLDMFSVSIDAINPMMQQITTFFQEQDHSENVQVRSFEYAVHFLSEEEQYRLAHICSLFPTFSFFRILHGYIFGGSVVTIEDDQEGIIQVQGDEPLTNGYVNVFNLIFNVYRIITQQLTKSEYLQSVKIDRIQLLIEKKDITVLKRMLNAYNINLYEYEPYARRTLFEIMSYNDMECVQFIFEQKGLIQHWENDKHPLHPALYGALLSKNITLYDRISNQCNKEVDISLYIPSLMGVEASFFQELLTGRELHLQPLLNQLPRHLTLFGSVEENVLYLIKQAKLPLNTTPYVLTLFCYIVQQCSISVIKKAIEHGGNLKYKITGKNQEDQLYLFARVLYNPDMEVVQFVLNQIDDSILHDTLDMMRVAALYNDVERIIYLLENNYPSEEYMSEHGLPIVHDVLRDNKMHSFLFFVRNIFGPNSVIDEETLLYYAIKYQQNKAIDILLRQPSFDIHYKVKEQHPIYNAVDDGYIYGARALFEAGATYTITLLGIWVRRLRKIDSKEMSKLIKTYRTSLLTPLQLIGLIVLWIAAIVIVYFSIMML